MRIKQIRQIIEVAKWGKKYLKELKAKNRKKGKGRVLVAKVQNFSELFNYSSITFPIS